MEGLPAAPSAHEILPQPGTIYSMAGPNAGLRARLAVDTHYPVEAICACGEVIGSEHKYDAWHHTGRKPGDPR